MISFKDFQQSLHTSTPAPELSIYLQSLWYDAKGDWSKAHDIIQDVEDNNASWIHAYLHRKEGDIGNADYWYRKAGKTRPSITLDEEWEHMVETLIQH